MFKNPFLYLALAGVVSAVLLVQKLHHTDPAPEPIAPPARTPYENSIGAQGIVESVNENVRVASSESGLVEEIFVHVGDVVKKDQPLFRLDSRSAQAMVDVQSKQLPVLEAQLKMAQSQFEDKQDQLMRMEKLRADDVATVDEWQRISFAMQSALIQVEKAKADLAFATSQLEQSKVRLNILTVTAPRDSTVLQINIRKGEYAPQNMTEGAIMLGEVYRLQLRADVDEQNASRVIIPCTGVAYIKGQRANPIPLIFSRIEPYVIPKKSLTGDSSEKVDTRVLQVIFTFERPAIPVYVGQQMDVFLDTDFPNKSDATDH